ncbi:WD40 repeat-like protein [Mycena albidolilacea]|uniref:WD40 repeat-like protein n=1 Tax=Mycena albidolilacea TaxID=1033008 RepID=A0AAD6ZKE3_9AGAR|nr:WD40 repeat-like protein [Mycena albidolilacea]
MSSSYSLLVRTVDEIPWRRSGATQTKNPSLYVAINLDGIEVQRTQTVKWELSPKWDHMVLIPDAAAVLSLRLFHNSSLAFTRDKCLGTVDTDIATLRKLCGSDGDGDAKVVNLELTGVEGAVKGRPAGTISVGLMRSTQAASLAVDQAQKAAENVATTPGLMTTGGIVVQSVAPVSQLNSALASITSRLHIIVRVGDKLATIHPYANIAWKVLTSVYQVSRKQQDTDEKLLKLVETMVEVYSFVSDVDSLIQKIQGVENKLALAIVKQTVECALFIQEYTANGFCNRAIRNTWTQADKKINDLSETLLRLRASFDGGLTIQTLFVSTKMLEKVEGLEQADTLKKLNPVDMNATLRIPCLPGTRQEILDDITGWLTVPSDSGNILWLSGVAGSGKSTISTTVSESFRALDRLGVFLFFDRNDQSRSHPNAVIRTIAYSLALFNPHIGSAISAAIQRDPAVVNAPMRTQFRELLLDPLQSAEQYIQGPILLILDALDECGDPDSRAVLLSLLSVDFPKLPQLFRVLITSRRESDIVDYFGSGFTNMYLDPGARSTTEDVELFLRHELFQIQQRKRLSPTWPGEHSIQSLVDLSGGLFVWASTAIRFMNGYRPDERLEILVAQKSTAGFNLDHLYSVALRNSGPWDTDKTFAQDAQAVLACVVLGKIPMSDRTIDMLLYSGQQGSANVLEYLGCVVHWSPGQEARTLHASFADYLTDTTRSGSEPWSIDPKTHHHALSLGCLRNLHHELRFNMCGLEDSHRRNADVIDMAQRVADKVSPQLLYSSCFWFTHVRETKFDNIILDAIEKLLLGQFLYWLEVLSILGRIPIGTSALAVAANYVKDQNADLEDFIADALRFVAAFGPAIATSAPHIYLSSLPFAPHGSKIAKRFGSMFPGTLKYQCPLGEDWPRIQKILQGHSNDVTCAHFSPDDTRIASGSLDNTVRVWDAQTGLLVIEPLDGHTGWVASIHFSRDGTRIVSGSWDNTLRVWDANTGALAAGPFEGHSQGVVSVSFSPDSTRVASGSLDKTVRVWDCETGVTVIGPLRGHTGIVSSVHFSPDGMRIASGASDRTVRVWDAQTGAAAVEPFRGHTDSVNSVHFSPTGTRIASGSEDHTVRVWDAQTGILLAGPFLGHIAPITSVVFSPDGTRIASGSKDMAVYIWSLQTGEITGTLEGHTDSVTSVDFSSDSGRIVSASDDGTVRVWDAQTGSGLPGRVDGHTSWVTSLQFSPNGTQIVSGSGDSTIRVWNARTGTPVTKAFGSTSAVISMDLSPDGARIASGSENNVCVWDAQTGTLLAGPFEGHTDAVCCVRFSPDGTRIASASQDQTVRVWGAEAGATVAGPFHAHSSLNSVHFSPDGSQVTSGTADNTTHVWDIETGMLIAEPFKGHTDWVASVQFSPDGTHIASGSRDNTVCVWDSQTGALVLGPLKGHTHSVHSVTFSPDGAWIASGSWDNTVRVWDSTSGSLVAGPFEGHTNSVLSVCFSPDSRLIASGSMDTTIRVWETKSSAAVPGPLGDYPSVDDGWILNSAGDLMFWVPPWLRDGLCLPHNTVVICSGGTTKLDLSQFAHGTAWQGCSDPNFRDMKIDTH